MLVLDAWGPFPSGAIVRQILSSGNSAEILSNLMFGMTIMTFSKFGHKEELPAKRPICSAKLEFGS